MPLLDYSQHAHVAPNSRVPCNTHTIMHAAEQYIFHTPGLLQLGKNNISW